MDEGCVVILAGGRGSRLKPYTSVLPKPLIPVCDVPILEILVHQLRSQGFRRLILAVNHHEGLLRSYFGDGSAFGVDVSYSKERRALGTIGPLHLVADRLPEHFLVMNGDLLTDMSFRTCLDRHVLSRRSLTVGTSFRVVRIGDGVIETNDASEITGFREKPTMRFRISNGVYAMSRSVLDYVRTDRPFGMDELVLAMLRDGAPVGTQHHEGEWYDIGCAADLERANVAFAGNRTRFLATGSEMVGVAS